LNRPQNLQEVRESLSPEKVALVCMVGPRRIGILSFIVFLEHRYFPPGTPKNELFQVVMMEWQEMKWCVVVIPEKDVKTGDDLAASLGLRRADGVPTLLSAAGVVRFPLDQDNVFTIENVPGHFAYHNDPGQNRTAIDFEDEAVDREIAEFERRAACRL
jgi:hypothetical protein